MKGLRPKQYEGSDIGDRTGLNSLRNMILVKGLRPKQSEGRDISERTEA